MQNDNDKVFIIPAAFLLAVGLALGAWFIAGSLKEMKRPAEVVSVTGSAQKIIDSDVIKWGTSISRHVNIDGLKEGYNQMNSDTDKLKKFFEKYQINAADITFSPINVMKDYEKVYAADGSTGGEKQSGYTLTQEVLIESKDVDKVAKAAEKSGELVQDGLPIANRQIEYYYSKLQDLKMEMLAEATRNAEGRASSIADSAGSKVDKLLSADMGVFQLTPVNSIEISDWGMYDTSSLKKQITAIVRTQFKIK